MNQLMVCTMARQFTQELLYLNATEDITPLLTPQNVMIREDSVHLREAKPAGYVPFTPHPGYSAPEVYQNRVTPATHVYFVGALMGTLLTGTPPPDAMGRMARPEPLFVKPGTLAALINAATELDENKRTASLSLLLESLLRAEAELQAEQNTAPPHIQQPQPYPAQAAVQQAYMPQAQAAQSAPPVPPPSSPMPYTPPTAAQNLSYVPQAHAQQAGQPGNVEPGYGGQYPQPTGYVGYPGQPAVAQKNKKNRAGKTVLSIVVIILFLFAAFGGYTAVQYSRAEKAMEARNYADVLAVIDATPWLRGFQSEMYNYSRAKVLLNEGNLEQSLKIFQSLGNYQDSAAQVLDIQFDQAIALMEEGKLEKSLEIFKQLGEHKNSAEYAKNLQSYLHADTLKDPVEQFYEFRLLGDFLDSASRMQKAADGVYETAMDAYKNERFTEALAAFNLLPEQEAAAQYAKLCDLWTQGGSASAGRELLPAIQELAKQVDAGPVLMSNEFFMVFIEGNWASSDGGGELEIDKSSFDLTVLELPTGTFTFRDKAIEQDDKVYYTFAYITYDQIKVTSAQTGTEYIFDRK